jgi:hypothetical protein
MSITLCFGNDNANNIQIDSLTDLENSAATLFNFAETVISGLAKPVADFDNSSGPVTFSYQSGNNAWTAGDFSFGLSGGVSGSINVYKPNQTLLSFTDSFPTTVGTELDPNTNNQTPEPITVPNGQFYVSVELDLTLSANAAANVQLGSVGIQGSAGTSDTFAVRFYKNVPGSTNLGDTMKQAFAGFVLPLHPQTYQHLQTGDILYHQFNGTLNLGFGANVGLDKVFFSGQYQADIPSAPAAPSVSTSVEAEIKAGATLGVTFKYTGSYEAMLSKTDDNTGRYHLFRNKTTDLNFNVGGTVEIIADPTVTMNAGSLQTLAQQALPGGTGAVAGQILSGKAQAELNNWVTDVQNKIDSWLDPFQEGETELQLSIERTQSPFLLMDVTFDLNALGFTVAWSKVVAGDFNGALALSNGGITLSTGTGLENFYTRKTSITFNLFGLFRSEWDVSRIDNYSIIYAGNNTFHLIEAIGERNTSKLNSSGRETDVYFAAQATNGPTGLSLAEADLHFLLKAIGNKGFGTQIAGLLSTLATGSMLSQLSKQILASAQQKQTTQSLEFIFTRSAYGRLNASDTSHGPVTDQGPDRTNYAAFAAACSQFESAFPANFSFKTPHDVTYDTWSIFNIGANDTFPPPPNAMPYRRNSGDSGIGSPAQTFIDAHFGNPQTGVFLLIAFALQNAANFMNLCEDLRGLALALAGSSTSWNQLHAEMQKSINSEVPVDFLIPTIFALAGLMGQNGVLPGISGPADNAAQEASITVQLKYS